MTEVEMIASRMAMRNYQEKMRPIIDSLTSEDAKAGYVKTMLMGFFVEMADLTGDAFEAELDELVEMSKQEIKINMH